VIALSVGVLAIVYGLVYLVLAFRTVYGNAIRRAAVRAAA
jgi:hypothetical protein